MQSSPLSSVLTKRHVADAWSPTFVTVSVSCALALVLLVLADPLFLLLMVGIVLPALVVTLCWLCYDLVTLRFRHALSIAIAAAAAASVVYSALLIIQIIAQRQDRSAFHRRQPEFERQVEEARAKRTTTESMQLVVDFQDRSSSALTNSFYYVVYDETDGAGPYNSKYWAYNGSSTGVISVGLPMGMRRLAGHYYDFSTSY